MKHAKIGILVFGVVGLVGLFMIDITAIMKFDKVQAIMMLAAFAAPAVMGAMALAKPPMLNWQASVSLAGFALALVRPRMWKLLPDFLDLNTGWKLLLVATVAGIIVSILAVAKPETQS